MTTETFFQKNKPIIAIEAAVILGGLLLWGIAENASGNFWHKNRTLALMISIFVGAIIVTTVLMARSNLDKKDALALAQTKSTNPDVQ